MKRTILIFGLISGVISSLMMIATVPFMNRNGFDHGYVLGYTTIVLSLMLTFFGVRSYRDNVGKGLLAAPPPAACKDICQGDDRRRAGYGCLRHHASYSRTLTLEIDARGRTRKKNVW